jgi:hypothetical protein
MSKTSITTPLPAAPPDAANDRDAKGHFVKGNKGGPGNPLAGKVNKVRKAFLEFFEGAGMKVLCEFMLRKALSGDPRFCRIILQYTIGKLPSDDGFADFDADAALAAAEAVAEMADQLEQASDAADTEDGMATAESSPADSHPQSAGDPAASGAVQDAPRKEALAPGVGQPSGLPTTGADPTTMLHVGHLPAAALDFRSLEDLGSLPPPSTNGVGDARQIRLVSG